MTFDDDGLPFGRDGYIEGIGDRRGRIIYLYHLPDGFRIGIHEEIASVVPAIEDHSMEDEDAPLREDVNHGRYLAAPEIRCIIRIVDRAVKRIFDYL